MLGEMGKMFGSCQKEARRKGSTNININIFSVIYQSLELTYDVWK